MASQPPLKMMGDQEVAEPKTKRRRIIGDALRALREESTTDSPKKVVVHFPDPEVSEDIIKGFHPAIAKVHFQVPVGPRYCSVKLHDEADTEKTIEDLEKISFGSGKLSVRKEEQLTPENIDPYTLFIGNLSYNVTDAVIKENFPSASRINIFFDSRMKHTKYCMAGYDSVDSAITDYRATRDLIVDSRRLTIKFRRRKGQEIARGGDATERPENDSDSD